MKMLFPSLHGARCISLFQMGQVDLMHKISLFYYFFKVIF